MNKQIEKILYDISCIEKECDQYCNERRCRECRLYFLHTDCENQLIAEGLFSKGYRRQDEVAREILTQLEEEIKPLLEKNYRLYTKYLNEQDSQTVLRFGGKIDALRGIYCFIEDLKKKYGVKEE